MAEDKSTICEIYDFASEHPTITCLTSSSPEFGEVRYIYAHPEIIPLAIIRPATVQDVQTVVSFLATHSIDFTVRSGGHDMHGRSMKQDTVALDMRLINNVTIHPPSSNAAESGTPTSTAIATIGGGSLIGDLISSLQAHGYTTPVGSVPAVGYVGWAMYGGYGAYSAQFGLGVDQIVGARVVNARGELVEADEDLLKGLRGAGGAFGVVVELTVKVYRIDKILAGMVMFESTDLSTAIPTYNKAYRSIAADGLPPPLSVHQGVLNAPTPTFTVLFVWSSPDLHEGYKWLDKIKNLTPCIASTVQETTPRGCLEEADRHFAKSTRGRMWTISMKKITNEVARVIAQYTAKMPEDPHILFDMHELRACSPSARPNYDSVFSAREPHFEFEINTIVEDEGKLEAALAWGEGFREALSKTSVGNLMPVQYLSFMREEEVDHAKVFGQHLPLLKELKQKLDPGNVFKSAISYL